MRGQKGMLSLYRRRRKKEVPYRMAEAEERRTHSSVFEAERIVGPCSVRSIAGISGVILTRKRRFSGNDVR